MKKFTLILLSLTITLTAGWWRTYGGKAIELARCVRQTSDGGYIILGEIRTEEKKGDIWLIKTDEFGDTIWSKTYGGDLWDIGYSVIQTQGGDFLITGFMNATNIYSSEADLWIIRTDSLGEILWSRNYGGMYGDEGRYICETNDGHFVITGMKSQPNSDGQVWLLKINQEGDTLWTKTYTQNASRGYWVEETTDGGYIIASGVEGYETYDLFLIKTDSLGDSVWTYTYNNPDIGGYALPHDEGHSVKETHEGCFVVSGRSELYDYYGDFEETFVFACKIDSLGNELWISNYSVNGFQLTSLYPSSVDVTEDGGCIVSSGHRFIIKFDEGGNIEWDRYLGDKSFSHFVQETTDKGYIFAGMRDSDLYLLKTDSLGLLAVEEPVTQPETQDWQVLVPVGREIVLMFNESSPSLTLQVYDASGQKVDELHSTQTSGTIYWGEGHGAGVYFIRIEGDASATTHKVILVR